MWCPCVTSQVKEFVENCRVCAKESQQQKELLIPTPLPDYPWQMVGSDIPPHMAGATKFKVVWQIWLYHGWRAKEGVGGGCALSHMDKKFFAKQ